MKIFLFGSSGMLGNYIYRVLQQNSEHEIIPINRDIYDVITCDYIKLELIFKESNPNDIIINCIGLIPQREPDERDLITINTLFPIKLGEIANKKQMKFIHITTDCVFSGEKGDYNEISEHDSNKLYGITKSLGEHINGCIIRTSIIGEENSNKLSLLEWVKKNKNGKIQGFSNFYWNGITCLTLAEIIKKMIIENKFWTGVRHIYSPEIVNKYSLCKIINDIYNLNIHIEEYELDSPKYMTLTTIYENDFLSDILPIEEQIYKMANKIQPYNKI
jgi:dTDP-4-dehydrorhamnose reductase